MTTMPAPANSSSCADRRAGCERSKKLDGRRQHCINCTQLCAVHNCRVFHLPVWSRVASVCTPECAGAHMLASRACRGNSGAPRCPLQDCGCCTPMIYVRRPIVFCKGRTRCNGKGTQSRGHGVRPTCRIHQRVPPDDLTELICTAALWINLLVALRSFFVCARKLAQKHTSLPAH
jgi:hypothetical protein